MDYRIPALACAAILVAGAAHAENTCTAPANMEQAQQALLQKLTEQGWAVRSVEVQNNCFEVFAISSDGQRVEGEFDPQTLALLTNESEGDSDSDAD